MIPRFTLPPQCALRCQDWVLLLSQLLSSAEVAAACPHAAAVMEPLGAEWRKLTLAAHSAAYLPPCMQVRKGSFQNTPCIICRSAICAASQTALGCAS